MLRDSDAGTAGGKLILAGDVGGTKILLEVGDFRSGRWRPALARRYLIEDFQSMDGVLGRFLEEWNKVRRPGVQVERGALGVAGPSFGNKVVMTNRPWRLDGDVLGQRFEIPRLRVLNDLAAAAHALDNLVPKDSLTIQAGKAVSGAPRVLMGVGTGLGVAYLVGGEKKPGTGQGQTSARPGPGPGQAPVQILAGEGGHVGYSPASPEQRELFRKLTRRHARVEAEHVVSGSALERDGIDLFTANLGNVAGDHALSLLACGGVYLCGGVIARIAPSIPKEIFSSAFAAKGSHASILMRIPVRAIVNERLVLLGAARSTIR
jgi:glucokinase